MVKGKRCHCKRPRNYLYQNFKPENAIEEEIELDNDSEGEIPKIQEETVTPNISDERTDLVLKATIIPSEQGTLIKDQPCRSHLRDKIILRRIINLTERRSDYLLLNGPLYIKKSSLNHLDYQLDNLPLRHIFRASIPGKSVDDNTEAEPYYESSDKNLTDENTFLSLTPSHEIFESNARNADILLYQFKPKEDNITSQDNEPRDVKIINDIFEFGPPDQPPWMQHEPQYKSMEVAPPTMQHALPTTEYKQSPSEHNPYRQPTMEYKPPTMEHKPPTMEHKPPIMGLARRAMEYSPPIMGNEPDDQHTTYNLPTQSQFSYLGGQCGPNCVNNMSNEYAPVPYCPTNECSPECIHNPKPNYYFKPQPCSSQCSPDCLFNPQRKCQPKPDIPKCSPKCKPKPKCTYSRTIIDNCSQYCPECNPKPICCCARPIDNCDQYYPECKPNPKCKPIGNCNQCSPKCKPKPKCSYARSIENCCNQYYPECRPIPKCSYAKPIENCCHQYYPECKPKPKCSYSRPVDKCTQCCLECIPKPTCSRAQAIVNCNQPYPECIFKPTCSHAQSNANCTQLYPDCPPKPNNRSNPQNNTRTECSRECKFNNTQPIYFFLNETIYECNSEGEICRTSLDIIPDSKPNTARDNQIIKSRPNNMYYFKDLSAMKYDSECSKYKSYVENMFFPAPRSIPLNQCAVNMQPTCFFDLPANENDTTNHCNSECSFKMHEYDIKAEVRFQSDPQKCYPDYEINVQNEYAKQCSSKINFSTKTNCTCDHQLIGRCSSECDINTEQTCTTQCISNAQPKCSCGLQIDCACSPECDINVEARTNPCSPECTYTGAKCTCDQLNDTCSPECIINTQDDTTNQCSYECTLNTNPKCTCGQLNSTCSPECNVHIENETTNQYSCLCIQPKCTCCINIDGGCSPECDINMQDDATNLFCGSECPFNLQPNCFFSQIKCTCQHSPDAKCSPECDTNKNGVEGRSDPNLQDTFVSQCSLNNRFNLQPIYACGRLICVSKASRQSNAYKCDVEGTNLKEISTKSCSSDCRINSQTNCTCGSTHKCSSECNINVLKKQHSSKYLLKAQPKFIIESKIKCLPDSIINKSNIEGYTIPEDISLSQCSNLQQSENQLNQKCSTDYEIVLKHVDAHSNQHNQKCQVKKQSKCVFADLPILKCISHDNDSKNTEFSFKQPKCSCAEGYECSSTCDISKWKNGDAIGADECKPDSSIDNTKSKKNLDNEALRICRRCCERNKEVIKITRDKEKIPEQIKTGRHPIDEEEKLLHSCLLCCKRAKCVGTSSENSHRQYGIQCSFCMESSKPRSANPLDISDSEAEFLVNSYVPRKTCDFTLSECHMKRTHGEKYGDVKYHFLMVDVATEKNQVVDSSTSSSATNLQDELAERRARKAKIISSKKALEANKKLLETKPDIDEKKKPLKPMESIPESIEAPSEDTVFYSQEHIDEHQKRISIVSWSEEPTDNIDKELAEFIDERRTSEQKTSLFEEIIKQEKRKINNNQKQAESKYPQNSDKDRTDKNEDRPGWFSFLKKKRKHAQSRTSTVTRRLSLLDDDEVDDEGRY
ncbi:unnamed protein product [Psylliodes chrysocephalus]|uniref:Uncharacterized protein n=1 Tax=Psylliodes chrysocephalus TaxID=3402493 RepID=A0A9P0G898_9CUCU|nr:unnamed protein product [Psylliodes chrysocephala]